MSSFEIFSYSFIWQAIFGGLLIAVFTSLIGTFLVLKRLSLMGDSLSHVALSGVAIGFLTKTSPLFCLVRRFPCLGGIKLYLKRKSPLRGFLGVIRAYCILRHRKRRFP